MFTRIVETTQHPAAAASFASIMFAPQAELSFKEALSRYATKKNPWQLLSFSHSAAISMEVLIDCRCQMNNTPICLAYGKDDPWVMPICGMQVKNQVPDAPYYEISPAGHCPHDEVPEVLTITTITMLSSRTQSQKYNKISSYFKIILLFDIARLSTFFCVGGSEAWSRAAQSCCLCSMTLKASVMKSLRIWSFQGEGLTS